MEDVSVRAISIGVGVLLTIATITAVMTYYNTARDLVNQIGSGVDIAELYDKSIEEILLKENINGTDVINILSYFNGKNNVEVKVSNIKYIDVNHNYGISEENPQINLETINDNILKNTYSARRNKIIKYILPNSKYKLDYTLSGNVLKIEIE